MHYFITTLVFLSHHGIFVEHSLFENHFTVRVVLLMYEKKFLYLLNPVQQLCLYFSVCVTIVDNYVLRKRRKMQDWRVEKKKNKIKVHRIL